MLLSYLVFQLVFVTARASVVFEDCGPMPYLYGYKTLLRIVHKLYEISKHPEITTASCNHYDNNLYDEYDSGGLKVKCDNFYARGSAYDLQTVNIQGCGMRLPCFVTLGDRIPVNVRFLADFASRQLDQDVTIQINFVHARTPVTPDPCETVMCPVRTDAETAFTSVMSVPTGMALNQRGYLQWQVYNETGRRVLCYRVMVQTQNFLQKFLRQYLVNLWDARDEQLGESIFKDKFNNYTARYFNSSLLVSKLMSIIKANFHW